MKNGKQDDKCAFIDKTGKTIIPCQYDWEVFGFHEGLARVRQNGKYGFIDKTGKFVIPCQFDEAALTFHDGLAKVKQNGKWGFIKYLGQKTDTSCPTSWLK